MNETKQRFTKNLYIFNILYLFCVKILKLIIKSTVNFLFNECRVQVSKVNILLFTLGVTALEHAAWSDDGISSSGDIQDLTGCFPVQRIVGKLF